MKTIIYSAVSSTNNQTNESIPSQAKILEKYCTNKGYEIVQKITSTGDKKNGIEKLIKYINDNFSNEKVAVCFTKIDRLQRSILDKNVSYLYEMALGDKIELHIVSDNIVINNKMSAIEKFQFGISLGLAKYYSDAISNSVKKALEQKRRNGEWASKPPFGYLNAVLPNNKKTLVIDQEKAKLIKRVFELKEQELSEREIIATLRNEFPYLSITSTSANSRNRSFRYLYFKLLKNESFYRGYISLRDMKFKHIYERIL